MRLARLLRALSDGLARVDRVLLQGLIAAVALLVLGNVAGRALGATLSWADELAIQAMVLAGFVGASLMFRLRRDPAVLLLHEYVPAPVARGLRVAVALAAIGFGVSLGWMCWVWFDPVGLWRAGFDVGTFEMTTFNFIYTETTPVMGLPSTYFFAVLPWFALTLTVHALHNLLEDLGVLAPRVAAEAGGGQRA